MKLSRLATTLATTIGLAFVGRVLRRRRLGPFAPGRPLTAARKSVTPPPAASTTSGTSVWWFVLVAAAAVVATVAVMSAVRTLRARRMIPTAG